MYLLASAMETSTEWFPSYHRQPGERLEAKRVYNSCFRKQNLTGGTRHSNPSLSCIAPAAPDLLNWRTVAPQMNTGRPL